ncbi:hypothetical protein ACK8HY_09540 [Sphingobacterium sp. NGMCC 1.201703]|uniref:hypothetical protein n=1 Tax=Sphingobacterium sp. NGMCC 1.201703 TaxID=3388657 RepID=UPI0039FD3BF2
MGRVINALPHLEGLLSEGESFIIGFGTKSLTTEAIHYRDLGELVKGNIDDLLVRGKKGYLKENIFGKFVRKQPENKQTVNKHIKYTRKDGRLIEYDRVFEVWEKELLHKFGLILYKGRSPQDEVILHFPKMIFNSNDEMVLLRAKAAMNIASALGGYFQIYNLNLEPVLKVTATFDRKILAKGVGGISNKLEQIQQEFFGGNRTKDNSGNSYRFSVLKDYNVTDIYDGEGGFNEYFHFEFASDNIVLLENLRSGNATYIFDLSKYDKNFVLDKSNAKLHPAFLKRVIHHNLENWKIVLSNYLITKKDDDETLLVS